MDAEPPHVTGDASGTKDTASTETPGKELEIAGEPQVKEQDTAAAGMPADPAPTSSAPPQKRMSKEQATAIPSGSADCASTSSATLQKRTSKASKRPASECKRPGARSSGAAHSTTASKGKRGAAGTGAGEDGTMSITTTAPGRETEADMEQGTMQDPGWEQAPPWAVAAAAGYLPNSAAIASQPVARVGNGPKAGGGGAHSAPVHIDKRSLPPGMQAATTYMTREDPAAELARYKALKVPLVNPKVAVPVGLCLAILGACALIASFMYKETVRSRAFIIEDQADVKLIIPEVDRDVHRGFTLFIKFTDDCGVVFDKAQISGPPVGGPLAEGFQCGPSLGGWWDEHVPPLQPFAHLHPFHDKANGTAVPGKYIVSSPVPMWVLEVPKGLQSVEVSPPSTLAGKLCGAFALLFAGTCFVMPFIKSAPPLPKE